MEPCKRAAARARLAALVLLMPGLLALPSAGLAAAEPASSGLPGLEPSEAVAHLATQQEPLPVGVFLEAALRFSGAEGPALEAAGARALALAEAVSSLRARPLRERAETLLEILHGEVFSRYDERQTRLDDLLATGRFNCVSSAVLYGLLARSLGLEFRAVQTPDHAFIRVLLGSKGYDVETTNLYGFDPGSRREFTDSFGRVTGYSYVPPGQYSRRKELGDKGLLALILYNRNAYDTETGRYLEALQPAVDAHALLRDADSAERLALSCLNVASYYGMAGSYDHGVGFLDEAVRGLTDPRLTRVREDLLHNWAVSLIEARRLEEAQGLIDARRAAGELSEREWRSLGVTIWQLRAQEASLVSGYEVYVHNQVAGLVNAGRLEEARRVVREALRVLPGSSRLRQDEALLSRR